MSNFKKALLAILVDFILLLVIIWAFLKMITNDVSPALNNICKVIIIAGIPTMFVISVLAFARDKYSYKNMTEETPDKNDNNHNT